MSIPESAWPEGFQVHVVNEADHARWEGWARITGEDGESFIYGSSDPAPDFGLPPGTITFRHAAELESLRADLKESKFCFAVIQDRFFEASKDRDKLRVELEKERMRLVACGVVALSDTEESAKTARNMHPDYRSASCDDVARRVDECMELRAEVERLRGIVPEVLEQINDDLCVENERLRAEVARLTKAYETLDRQDDQVMTERDNAIDMADELASYIAALTGQDIGEHTSANCPWRSAIEAAEYAIAKKKTQ